MFYSGKNEYRTMYDSFVDTYNSENDTKLPTMNQFDKMVEAAKAVGIDLTDANTIKNIFKKTTRIAKGNPSIENNNFDKALKNGSADSLLVSQNWISYSSIYDSCWEKNE